MQPFLAAKTDNPNKKRTIIHLIKKTHFTILNYNNNNH
ncbi:hypothetical protein CLV80_10498 [Yoonia maritima]|uniref:Uncharacterized protein n=1 Tax=Yoonia maritima TaxID=1435347 RepID=A0A2T0VZY1_9RHOB|nr:hypothetical protein CLV80_10498 [Yoonia maritima]